MHDIKNENSITEVDRHLPFLDGLRGVAALWVFISHIMLLTGSYIPILSKGELAVDLFMVLSGILITHNYLIKEDHEPWYSMGTWVNFWIRRVFRIAPVYYVMLVIAIGLGPWIGDWREYISIFFLILGLLLSAILIKALQISSCILVSSSVYYPYTASVLHCQTGV
ncbi:MAG: acyltransferase [Thermoproteota archaeon]|nr:acyltransferase [Thermoproteota archaeon]